MVVQMMVRKKLRLNVFNLIKKEEFSILILQIILNFLKENQQEVEWEVQKNLQIKLKKKKKMIVKCKISKMTKKKKLLKNFLNKNFC